MAGSPQFKVYTAPDGKAKASYTACFKHPEDAAVLVAVLGAGTTIRFGHSLVLWTEGADGDAGDSYDNVGAVCDARLSAHVEKCKAERAAAIARSRSAEREPAPREW